MELDIFAWGSSIPRTLYLDKEALYSIVQDAWDMSLGEVNGVRIPGPLHVKITGFGYIDDDSMKEVLVRTELSPTWTYAIVRVTGPAMRS
jgi:hypothetical protein